MITRRKRYVCIDQLKSGKPTTGSSKANLHMNIVALSPVAIYTAAHTMFYTRRCVRIDVEVFGS